MEKIRIADNLIKSIKENLEKKDDGSYAFKYNKESMIIHSSGYGKELDYNPIEEVCKRFEEEIIKIIPNAVLILTDTFSCEVIISNTNKAMRKYHLMQQQIDFYDAVKTLFFPTMKEYLVKIGTSKPEWLPFSSGIKVEVEPDKKRKNNFFITIYKSGSKIWRGIEGTSIDFLKEDINYYLDNFKFRNPFPKETVMLPGEDITREELMSKPRSRKGLYISEFYSLDQKIKYIKLMLENFFEYYHQIINDNFFFIRNKFFLYSKLPLKMSVYINEGIIPALNGLKEVFFKVLIEKPPNIEKSIVEFHINEEGEYDKDKHIFGSESSFLNYLTYYKNPLPYIYKMIRNDLENIIQDIESYSIFEDFKPFEVPIESWIQTILKAEKRGGETSDVELKKIPTESSNKNGKGNDLYGHINALENGDGGYIFIGADESKEGLDKIVGLEPYLRDNNKTLDKVKREIIEKCFKYLHNYGYRVEANQYKGKTLIRIRVQSNGGKISTFYPEIGDPCSFLRLNGKKILMTPEQIAKRATVYQVS